MDEKVLIGFSGKLVYDKPVNDQFTLCKCYVMALGKNQNRTIISEESAQKALPTLFNIPVVGHLYETEDGTLTMGGHDMVVVRDDDGHSSFKSLAVPFGVIPNQNTVHYEVVEESDGSQKTYLVADVILWTGRYPELLNASLDKDVYFLQSMEIEPLKTSKEDGYVKIDEYQYSALCLLGRDVQPCFEQARVESYAFSAEPETERWSTLLKEFKEELTKCYSENNTGEADIVSEDVENLNEATENADVAETGEVVVETDSGIVIDSPADEYSIETQLTTVEVVGAEEAQEQTFRFEVKLTYEEKRRALEQALMTASVWNDSEYISYSLMDFDSCYVYCHYRHFGIERDECDCNLRIPYQEQGGDIIIDLLGAEPVRLVWLTKEDEKKLDDERATLQELAEYKAKRVEDDLRKEYSAVLCEFSDLGEIDEYKAIVKAVMDFENIDCLREKLFAIRGKYAKPASKKSVAQVRIPIDFNKKSNNADIDDFMSRYLPAKK